MGLFRSKDRALVDEWRGRSAELPDAGALSWKVVWSALVVDNADRSGPGAMSPIGLHAVQVPMRGETAAAYQGVRHGRPVHVRFGEVPRVGTTTAVWVGVATPPFVAHGDGGTLRAADGAADGAAGASAVLSSLEPAGVWHRMAVHGGGDGVLVSRQVERRAPQAWIHDLWLAERIADAVGSTVLAEPGHAYWELPYGVASEPWQP